MFSSWLHDRDTPWEGVTELWMGDGGKWVSTLSIPLTKWLFSRGVPLLRTLMPSGVPKMWHEIVEMSPIEWERRHMHGAALGHTGDGGVCRAGCVQGNVFVCKGS